MRILRFEIKNDKAVESFVHDANGEHVEIAGATATGKTTAASALWDIANKSPDCLRHGERKGYITLHLGDGKPDLIATREFTKKTSTVRIERADGKSVSAAEFKAMISHLSENPHRIMDMKPTERVQTLLAAAELGDVNLYDMDVKIAEAERRRLEAKRRADDFVPGKEPEKAEAVDVSAISKELEAVRDHNADVDGLVRKRSELADRGQALKLDIDELKRDLGVAEDALSDMREAYKVADKAVGTMKKEDTGRLQAQLASATEVNAKAAKHEQWEERRKQHITLMSKRDDADEMVRDLREQKAELLDNAKWPLDGLSIEDGNVLYKGALIENLGHSEGMLVCAALAIKDIEAHALHCVRMDGVESMSKEDFGRLQKLFGDHDIQVISTRVSRDDVEGKELVIKEAENSG